MGFGEVDAAAALTAAGKLAAAQRVNGAGGQLDIPTVEPGALPGGPLAPIVVVHRNRGDIMAYAAAATAAAVLAAIALAALVVLARRPRRRAADLETASMPPGDDLIG